MLARHSLPSFSILASAAVALAASSSSTLALVDQKFDYPSGIPYKVDTQTTGRGSQVGYNICNSTTEGSNSLCQTAFVNHIDDFCIWAPQTSNSTISNTESEVVAWCSKPGRGTRLIPAGALQGVQYTKTPGYVQVVGFIDQTLLNIQSSDVGGELDPVGSDGRGNPIGALVYSNAFASNKGNNNSFQQAPRWNNFMGQNFFCIKACDPAGSNAQNLCQTNYDKLGCKYNAPNNAQKGSFVSCEGDDQDPVGVYTTNNQVKTYTQTSTSAPLITSVPYQPRVPSSSNCVTFQSAQLYTSLPSATPTTLATSKSLGTVATGLATGLQIGPTPSSKGGAAKMSGLSPLLSLIVLLLLPLI